jgi:hypothetical protein
MREPEKPAGRLFSDGVRAKGRVQAQGIEIGIEVDPSSVPVFPS